MIKNKKVSRADVNGSYLPNVSNKHSLPMTHTTLQDELRDSSRLEKFDRNERKTVMRTNLRDTILSVDRMVTSQLQTPKVDIKNKLDLKATENKNKPGRNSLNVSKLQRGYDNNSPSVQQSGDLSFFRPNGSTYQNSNQTYLSRLQGQQLNAITSFMKTQSPNVKEMYRNNTRRQQLIAMQQSRKMNNFDDHSSSDSQSTIYDQNGQIYKQKRSRNQAQTLSSFSPSNKDIIKKLRKADQDQSTAILEHIKQNAKTQTDSNACRKDTFDEKTKRMFETGEKMVFADPVLDNKVLDQICKKVGVLEPHLSIAKIKADHLVISGASPNLQIAPQQLASQSELQDTLTVKSPGHIQGISQTDICPENESQNAEIAENQTRKQLIKGIRDMLKRNFFFLTPANPLEENDVFKQDFLHFRILETNLRQTKQINPMHQLRANIAKKVREPISGVKLPTLDQNTLTVGRRKQTFIISPSINVSNQLKGKGSKRKKPFKLQEETNDHVLENIRAKIEQEGVKSNKIDPSIGEEITRFENTNCFNLKPQNPDFDQRLKDRQILEAKREAEKKAAENAIAQRFGKPEPKISLKKQKEMQSAQGNSSLRESMALALRSRLKKALEEHVLSKIKSFNKFKVEDLIKAQSKLLGNQNATASQKFMTERKEQSEQKTYEELQHLPKFQKEKEIKENTLKARLLSKQDQVQKEFEQKTVQNYIRAQQEMANEHADYYRNFAITNFITEQFCEENGKFVGKYEDLITDALHSNHCTKNSLQYIPPHEQDDKVEAYLNEVVEDFEKFLERQEYHQSVNMIESRRFNLRQTRVDSDGEEISVYDIDGSDKEENESTKEDKLALKKGSTVKNALQQEKQLSQPKMKKMQTNAHGAGLLTGMLRNVQTITKAKFEKELLKQESICSKDQ